MDIEELKGRLRRWVLIVAHPGLTPDLKEALTAIERLEAEIVKLRRERSFVWKWIERAAFDTKLSKAECIGTLLHYPGAPWNEGPESPRNPNP